MSKVYCLQVCTFTVSLGAALLPVTIASVKNEIFDDFKTVEWFYSFLSLVLLINFLISFEEKCCRKRSLIYCCCGPKTSPYLFLVYSVLHAIMWMWALCVGEWDEMGFWPEFVIGFLASIIAMYLALAIHSAIFYTNSEHCWNCCGANILVMGFLGGCTIIQSEWLLINRFH